MTSPATAIDLYFQAISELQKRGMEAQRATLVEIAEKMAEVTHHDQRIFIFGTGHPHFIAEEGLYSAGGLTNAVPMLSGHFMLHNLPVLGSRLVCTPALAELILERYAPLADELPLFFQTVVSLIWSCLVAKSARLLQTSDAPPLIYVS